MDLESREMIEDSPVTILLLVIIVLLPIVSVIRAVKFLLE